MRLRPARFDEAELVRSWRNDLVARRMSLSARAIGAAAHRRWWARRWKDVRILVASSANAGVGYWRVDAAAGRACEVAVAIDPAMRGFGFGAQLIKRGTRSALRWYVACVAKIDARNVASVRAFERAGYRYVGSEKVGSRTILRFQKGRR